MQKHKSLPTAPILANGFCVDKKPVIFEKSWG
jgi:hypothetical protein